MVDRGDSGLDPIAHQPGDELQTEEEGSGFAALDAAQACGMKDLGNRVKEAATIIEFGKNEGRGFTEVLSRAVVAAQRAAAHGGCFTFLARREDVDALVEHGFSFWTLISDQSLVFGSFLVHSEVSVRRSAHQQAGEGSSARKLMRRLIAIPLCI